MEYPKITVITPSFNQGLYIEETITSILSQTYPNLEYLIIDGGSTDESVNIIKKYEGRITHWLSEPDHGQSEAINKGLKLSTGEIITWINSDDQLLPGSLLKIADLFSHHPKIGLIHGKTILFRANEQGIERGDASDLPFAYLSGMAFAQPSSFFRREAYEKTGLLNPSLHYGMDYDFFARMYLINDFLQVNESFSRYRLHNQSKSVTSQEKFAKEWAYVFSRILRSFKNTDHLIEIVKKLEIYVDQTSTYPTLKEIPISFLENSLLYFINFQIIFYYQSVSLKKVAVLSHYLKENAPDFYYAHDLEKVHWRSRLVPSFILKAFRKS